MTLRELYAEIGGDYDQALKVLRMDKLLDKHIRKFTQYGVIEALLSAGQSMDPSALFEAAHAAKGVCGNLGLVSLAGAASEITEEFRPGHSRSLSDEEVSGKLRQIEENYQKVRSGIQRYTES